MSQLHQLKIIISMKQIGEWRKLTNQITEKWIVEYFQLSEEDIEDGVGYTWIGGNTGFMFEFADYYVSFNDVLDCYKHNITREQFHNWHEYCHENQFVNISLVKFILSPEEKAKKESEELKRLKENVDFAEKEFKKAMENYKTDFNCMCGENNKEIGESYCKKCLNRNPLLCT